jgi:hypothetical protein
MGFAARAVCSRIAHAACASGEEFNAKTPAFLERQAG